MPRDWRGDIISDTQLAAAYLRERFEERYDIQIEIEVSGIDKNEKVFHEVTITQDISNSGCAFLLSIELKVDDIVSLRMVSRGAGETAPVCPSLFQVLRVKRQGNGWLVGAWKIDDGNVWGDNAETLAKRHGEGGWKSHKPGPEGRRE